MDNIEFKQLLQQGTTIVTSSKRLSRYLLKQYAKIQIADGKTVWETPDILPWSAWICRLWEELVSCKQHQEKLLLNAYQQRLVWHEIIQKSDTFAQLLQPAKVSKISQQAWHLSQQWQLALSSLNDYQNADCTAFRNWAKNYQQRCQKQAWIDIDCLEKILIDSYDKLINKLCLCGFDELRPAQQALIDVLAERGCEINIPQPKHPADIISCRRFANQHTEIKAVAHHIRQLLNIKKDVSIGVIVPNLRHLRSDIEDIFDDVLLPGEIYKPLELNDRPYNISLGHHLADYPLIKIALLILELNQKPMPLENLSTLLLSPFLLGAAQEMIPRAKLDAYLLKGESLTMLPSLLRYIAEKAPWSEQCPVFITILKQWLSKFQALPKKQTAGAWAESFSSLLDAFGWPGQRTLNSEEFQTVQAWYELLQHFSSLDIVCPSMNRADAVWQLRSLAHENIFQPRNNEVPVQIIGLLEVAGMYFDHLWVMGMHEENWPLPARANPFLPIKLQRELKILHASATINFEYTKKITERLVRSANEVIFSCPCNEEGRKLALSPVLRSYPTDNQADTIIDTVQLKQNYQIIDYPEKIFYARQLIAIQDDHAPPLMTKEISGGTNVLKNQAACPFRAFARHRLNAKALQRPSIALDLQQRGALVHQCLELFWGEIQSHQQLLSLQQDELTEIIKKHVAQVIGKHSKAYPYSATRKLMQIETDRLQNVLHDWLKLEREREPFIVIAREKNHEIKLGNFTIQTRMDRIDQLPDNRLMVIDYKTGANKISSWMSERPDEPQLPLYAIAYNRKIAVVAFAQIKYSDMKFIGLADGRSFSKIECVSKSRYTKTSGDWHVLVNSWKKNLSTLIHDFSIGKAQVDPKNRHTTCRYCDLPMLCRIKFD